MKRYESYKDSEIKWIGNIPIHWDVNTSKYYFYNTKEIVGKDCDKYERLALTLKGVIKRQYGDEIGLNPEKLDTYQIVKQNDLIFKLIDLENIKTSRVGLTPFDGIVSPAYIRLRKKRNICMKYYEYYFLNMWYRHVFNDLGSPGVRSNLSATELLNLKLIIPTLDEQKAVVGYLDTATADIDKAIAQQQQMIDLLNERKQIIIQKELLPNITQKKESDMWFGALPPKWQSIRLKYILAERNERSETGSEEPLSMSQRYGLIPTSQMDIIPNMAASFVGAKKAYIGDLVFNKLKAHLGVFAVSNYNGLVSPDYAVYYANSKVNLKYLQFLFKNPMMIAEFRRRSSGVGEGLTRLYTKDLFSIYIPLPSIEEQNRVVENIEVMTKQIANHIAFCENTIKLLQERKRIIINDVVTGKVKVS